MLLEMAILYISTLLFLLGIIAWQVHKLEKAEKERDHADAYAEKLKDELSTLYAEREAWKNLCMVQVKEQEETSCV